MLFPSCLLGSSGYLMRGKQGVAVDLTLHKLAIRNCRSCKDIPPMSMNDSQLTLKSLPSWKLLDNRIEKEYKFRSYLQGLGFANKIGHIAEEQDHHPDLLVRWRRVKLTFTTHSIKGLSENDFIMAAKAESEYCSTTTTQDDLSSKQKKGERGTRSH